MSESEPFSTSAGGGLMRGPRAHSIAWDMHDDWLTGDITCHAVGGADCRVTCSKDCESWTLTDHEHEFVDAGKCLFVEWIEATDGALSAHVGSHAPTDGFIEYEWDDGGYVWTYSDV